MSIWSCFDHFAEEIIHGIDKEVHEKIKRKTKNKKLFVGI